MDPTRRARRQARWFAAISAALLWPSPALVQPSPSASVEVLRYRDGSPCVDLRLNLPGQAKSQVLDSVCHGWSTFECAGNVLVDVHPVIQAHGVVLLPRERTTLDLTAAIGKEVRRRWPGYELNHLAFAKPICANSTLSVTFDGSVAPTAGGPGHGLKGLVSLASSRSFNLDLEAKFR